MKIKVCGITQLEQFVAIDAMQVDYAGLIFFPSSPRYVLKELKSREISSAATSVQKVGVFVNASEDDISTQVELYRLDLVQLHGFETPAFCRHIRKSVKVIKAFRLNSRNEQHIDWMVHPYQDSCDYYLFDFSREGLYGGTGEKFDWNLLERNKINKPFFLSGGIAPGDSEMIMNVQHPFLHAIDINSKFETQPGVKDIDQIERFITQLNGQ